MVDNRMFTLKVLQEEHKPWADSNFGERPSWQPLLGMVEELGELEEAINYSEVTNSSDAIADAIGDTMVFMADFSTGMGFDLGEIVKDFLTNCEFIQGRTYTMAVGMLAHSFLKMSQGIRGTREEHETAMKSCLGQLYCCLSDVASYRCNKHIMFIVEETWNVVKQRNWNKNKATGT